MKLSILTIVLDGMPWIEKHLPIFEKLECDWKWIIVHGAAMNRGSTAWCQQQQPRFSTDGTTEYLDSIRNSQGVTVIEKPEWWSKDEMVNAALNRITEPCILMEIDSDEIHTPQNIEKIVQLFEQDQSLGAIRMRCRYFVGPDLICAGENCWSNHGDYEWDRAWRFKPGMKFITHEPPRMNELIGRMLLPDESTENGLTFDHMAYATEAQCKFKEQFYDYDGLVNQWRALQVNQHWPVKLSRFFPFVRDGALVKSLR